MRNEWLEVEGTLRFFNRFLLKPVREGRRATGGYRSAGEELGLYRSIGRIVADGGT